MIDFIDLLARSFDSFDAYCYESFHIADKHRSHRLCVDDDNNSLGALFSLEEPYRLRDHIVHWIRDHMIKRGFNIDLKKKLAGINIGLDTFSLRLNDSEEFAAFLNVVRWYLEKIYATNYVFWFPQEDVFCMLCHENDLHLYFKPHRKSFIDAIIEESPIQNNTREWNHYYPCM